MSPVTPLTKSRQRSKTRKASPLTSRGWSLLKVAGRWSYPVWLQHSERVHSALGPAPEGKCLSSRSQTFNKFHGTLLSIKFLYLPHYTHKKRGIRKFKLLASTFSSNNWLRRGCQHLSFLQSHLLRAVMKRDYRLIIKYQVL